MELHSVHKTFHHSHAGGEEKQQMLNLNRRLETYLSRVKLLEEENALLAKEIQALRRSSHGASTRRKGLEEELRRARLEVDAAWRDRVLTEMEVNKVAEELQTLDLLRQREAQAHVEAKKKLEQSRKELQEEQRAQIWLQEKVSQLEHEMMHLVQTHQEDVAHMESNLNHSRATMQTTPAQRCHQVPNLQQLEQEFSQRASRAWQEAAEAHQGQIDRLEESLHQARSRLAQVGQEKSESLLKLQALEKELASAQDVRLHLEQAAAQQGDRYTQEVQQLQDHLERLEVEREELGQQIQHIVLQNRGLLQQKVALGLEVATYRALLDSESLRGDVSNQPRNITDAVFSPRGVKRNYQTQLSTSHKTTSLSAVRGTTGRGPTTTTAAPLWSRKPVTLSETPKVSTKPAYEETTKSTTWEAPYPKILQDGAVENFRPQEVLEKVTYAEPLSPPNEREAETTPGETEGEEDWSNVNVEREVVKEVGSYQVESGFSSEPPVNDEVDQHQFDTPSLTPHQVRSTEEPCGFSHGSDKDVPFEIPADKEDMHEPHAPIDAWVEKEFKGKEVEEMSDSETEAVIDPNFDSRTSSPVSECEPEESLFSKVTAFSRDENILKEDAAEIRQEIKSSIVGTNETEVEDKLYPDGEEMDTWDSVIERKVDLKTNDGVKQDEEKGQHAEPEEDISAREQQHDKRELREEFVTDVKQLDSDVATQVEADGQHAALDQEHAPLPDEEEDEDEDSQNVSVSWRTEVESDSYAQENTLADTRPLIRYKSDETDANTQASHMDESESSEGEQEKKVEEAGMWSEGKSKRFGTMEDLCEEVEAEALDEEYNLGHTHMEDRDDGESVTGSEQDKEVSEGYSDEESEAKPAVPRDVDYDEELETDRLVEQELENLATDSYITHFTQQQVRQNPQGKSVEEMSQQEEASCAEPEVSVQQQLASFTTTVDQPYENIYSSESSSVVMRQPTDAPDNPEEREEEDEQNESLLPHADVTEDLYGFTDFFSKPEMEEINKSEDPNSVLQEALQDVAAPTEVKEVAPVEASSAFSEQLTEDVADCEEFPDVLETAEWEVLENQSEEIRDQKEECDIVPESGESYLHKDEGVTTHKEEPLEISPDSVPEENDIFVMKESTELLNTNGKDNGLHDFFGSGVKNDFWASSLETGATYQPDDACNEAAEQTNQNLGFADNLVWGDSQNVVNWNSRVDIDSSKALAAEKEQVQMHSEVKQVLSRNVAGGELVDSDESDVEGESWSSGEERLYK